MSTRSTSSILFSSLRNPVSLIRRRNLGEPSSLFDFKEVISIPHNNQGPPPASPHPPNNNGPPLMVRPNGPDPDLRSMEELCQPSINGRGGPLASSLIQAADFRLLTQHMKQNGVSDDALRLSLFPYSLTHHATAWYDRLPRNFIHTFDDMMRKFLSKYFSPSMVTKLRNEITKFRQDLNESLFEAWERYKFSIDRCQNHNMLLLHSPSGSGSLPSNTVANPRGTLKVITTRSGVAYDGLMIPPTHSLLPKEVERETEATKDKKLSLPDLTLTRMALKLAIREELILRDGDEKLIVYADSTSKHPHKHGNELVNMINFIDITCEDRFPEVFEFKKSNHPLSGSTTPLFDSSLSLIPFETSDSLLEEEIEFLLTQDPSTESDIETIDPIFEKFIDEPALDYSPPPGDNDDDHDDLFDLKSDNDKWKKIFFEAHIVESNDLLPQLLDNDLNLIEEPSESSEIAYLSSCLFGNEDKVFNPGILILGGTRIFNEESKDKDLRDKDLILEERNFLFISSDQELLFFLELMVLKTLLSFSFENEKKFLIPGYSFQMEFIISLWNYLIEPMKPSRSLIFIQMFLMKVR
nr:hypothetical protein [Tanacetum cinerariifolium]